MKELRLGEELREEIEALRGLDSEAFEQIAAIATAQLRSDAPGAKAQYRKWKMFWLVGMACIVCSAGGDTVALNFGAQSVVAPLSSLTLVANAIIARAMHGELMTNRDYAATGLIIIGCVLSVAFAQHKDTLYCAEIIWNQFSTAGVIIYLLLICIVVFAGMLFSKWAERVRTELGADWRSISSGASCTASRTLQCRVFAGPSLCSS